MSLPAASAFSLSAAAEGRFAASGSLTFASARLARLAGLSVLDAADAPQRLEIDFAGLGPTDSAGLAVLLDWLAAAKLAGRSLQFLALPQGVVALARISDVEELLGRGV